MLYKEIDIVYYGLLRNARKHGRKDGATMHCCIEQLQGKLIYTRNTLVNAIRTVSYTHLTLPTKA